MSKQEQLITALHGFTVAMTKLSSVIHDVLIDPSIHAINSTNEDAPISKPTDVSTTVEPTGDLDGEGRPWIKGLHAENKATMSSPEIKGATKWKFKRGTAQEDKDAFHAKYPLGGGGTGEQSTTPTPATLPGTPPTKPTVPTPPTIPTPPTGPAVDENEEVRKSILESLKQLVEIGVEWEDLKAMFVEEFNSAQNGEQITLGSIPKDKYEDVDTFCATLVGKFKTIQTNVDELYTIAGEHKQLITDGLNNIFANYQSEALASVHYSNLDNLASDVNAMLVEWRKWAEG